ncbi:hypothetical protein KC324_g20236, partial [Hortaea werneckii]
QQKEWQPRFFTQVTEQNGKPQLTGEGKQVIDQLHQDKWHLEEPTEYGAI